MISPEDALMVGLKALTRRLRRAHSGSDGLAISSSTATGLRCRASCGSRSAHTSCGQDVRIRKPMARSHRAGKLEAAPGGIIRRKEPSW